MAIEGISGVVQPAIIRGDGLPHNNSHGVVESHQTTGSHVESAEHAVKSASPGQGEDQLKSAADKTNAFLKALDVELLFSIDEDTGKTVVKVTDKKTGDLIRQIPSDEMLAIAKVLDTLQGLIIRKKV
jgi:flagellar protein FlaG